jgi:restriction system-associated AAA family ATPase
MRLSLLQIDKATSCDGLLDGVEINFSRANGGDNLSPICMVGPNGSGKSQVLQLIAEIFQAAWYTHDKNQERELANTDTLFSLKYEIECAGHSSPRQIMILRNAKTRPKISVEMKEEKEDGWVDIDASSQDFADCLPPLIIGYTSGDNETLSLPFYLSRAGYARDVREAAKIKMQAPAVKDNRLLMMDYGSHLEILVANLLLGDPDDRPLLIRHAGLSNLASFRCVVQLKPSSGPKDGVALTEELKQSIDALRRAATCWSFEKRNETHIFDFFVDESCVEAFENFFSTSLELYRALHKLSLLNDLSISRDARKRVLIEAREKKFAARLPEPQDEDKVFRFERVRLHATKGKKNSSVDYVSLSDGEHQQAQITGIFKLIAQRNALFLLDEPESHLNPQWRIKFVDGLMKIQQQAEGKQELLLTTHSPFVPSDMKRENILVFLKGNKGVQVREPEIETFGTSFDIILEHCFDVRPPISKIARDRINYLKSQGSLEELRNAMEEIGFSVEKAFLFDRLKQLENQEK